VPSEMGERSSLFAHGPRSFVVLACSRRAT